ncbi:MAG: hypothetical protein QM719_12800 [Thermomonas sp.]
MSDGGLGLLLLGPAGGAGLYWALFRYYRNTDKSHGFERETAIEAKSITGMDNDRKVDEVMGTRNKRIDDDNVHSYRERVDRMRDDGG